MAESPRTPDPMGPSLDIEIEQYVAGFMASVTDEVTEGIVRQCINNGGSVRDMVTVALHSGMAHGARETYGEIFPLFDSAMTEMAAAVEGIEKLIKEQPQGSPEGLALRNRLASFMNSVAEVVPTDDMLRIVQARWGLSAETLDKPGGTLGEFKPEEYSAIASRAVQLMPYCMAAWVRFRDVEMECKCPYHIMEAWGSLPNLERQNALSMFIAQYPPGGASTDELVSEFAQWWVNTGRHAYEKAKARDTDAMLPPPVSAEEAEKATADLLGRIAAKK